MQQVDCVRIVAISNLRDLRQIQKCEDVLEVPAYRPDDLLKLHIASYLHLVRLL